MSDIKRRVYLDHAATTPVDPSVAAHIMDIYKMQFGNPSSIYREGQLAKESLEDARARVAKLFSADPSEIYFTSCGTESDNWAIKGAALAHEIKGRHIITTSIEHHAVFHTCQALEKQGFDVTYLPVDHDGLITPEQVKDAIRDDTILVSIMMANNEVGTILPIEAIGKICRDRHVLFHTDAVQAGGAIKLDVNKLNIDMMSLSAHKLYGPKGVGLLYMRRQIRIDPYLHGGAQERGRRAGTENLAQIRGFALALERAYEKMDKENERLIDLRDQLIEAVIKAISHVSLSGHRTLRLPGNAHFCFEFIEGESLLLLLDHEGFACSSGSACTSGSLDPSHVLLAMGRPHEIAHGSLRISMGQATTKEDIDAFVPALVRVVSRLREMSPLYADYIKNKNK